MSESATSPGRGGPLAAQRARAATTREALITAGRQLFAVEGYFAAGTPELAAAAKMTRGALHHHFSDKRGLFLAVFEQVLEEVNHRARATVSDLSRDTWSQLVRSLSAYLHLVAGSAEVQRILLIDGPAVLGWETWRDLQAEWVEAGIEMTLAKLIAEGVITPGRVEPLATLLQGAVNEAALSIAHSGDPLEASQELTQALVRLLEGLRVGEGGRGGLPDG